MKEKLQELLESLTESLENGYNREMTIRRVSNKYNLTQLQADQINVLMILFSWKEDPEYIKFTENVMSIL
jgi:hypothetical protein